MTFNLQREAAHAKDCRCCECHDYHTCQCVPCLIMLNEHRKATGLEDIERLKRALCDTDHLVYFDQTMEQFYHECKDLRSACVALAKLKS